MDTKESKYSKLGDGDFRWQKDCINRIQDSKNVILSSPTGSGKTHVFLEWAKKQKNKPIIITAPIKALSNQRYRELLAEGYVVGLETGDIKNVPENCDFICCTQEIYTNKYVELENVTLIMDEFHYIFENSNRARTYIDALHNSKASNILLCSATLGDIDELTEYVNRVSGREFLSYENDSRITSLFFDGDIKEDQIKNSLIVAFSRENIKEIIFSLRYERSEQGKDVIEKIEQIAEEYKISDYEIINNAKKGIAGYYGALLPKEKLFIEKCFEQNLIDTVVGTDALALGVNFPVENVVFAQLAKYYEGPISRNLFDQLAGRAGRKGYFDEGHVYYCSDFAQNMEARGYDTERLFERILEKPNENISITLTPNIKNLLMGKTSIAEEAEYISRFSTTQKNVDEVSYIISKEIDYIMNEAFDEEVSRIVNEALGIDDDEYNDGEDYEYERYLESIGPLKELIKLTPENVRLLENGCNKSAFKCALKTIKNGGTLFDCAYYYMEGDCLQECLDICSNKGETEHGVKLSEVDKITDAQKKLVLPFLQYIFENKDEIQTQIEEAEERFCYFIQEDEERQELKEGYSQYKQEFLQNIARVYFDEYTPEKNCQIFFDILRGVQPEIILDKYAETENFYDMLQFRKYVNSLPKKYRKGLTKINDMIREIDETAIDEFRGSVSINEVSKQLEQDGRYDGERVMKTLKEQEENQGMEIGEEINEEEFEIPEQ